MCVLRGNKKMKNGKQIKNKELKMNQHVRGRFDVHLNKAKQMVREIQKGIKRVEAWKKGRMNWGHVGSMEHYADILEEVKIDILNEEE